MELRDNLLVTMGARAAYMHDKGDIKLPEGVEGEKDLADFVVGTVTAYMAYSKLHIGVNFDEFIEKSLMGKYGPMDVDDKPEPDGEFFMNANSIDAITHTVRDIVRRQHDSDLKTVMYALYKCVEHLENQILELERRTR